jgi:hypothetical protein
MTEETQEGEYLPAEDSSVEDEPSMDSETLLNFTQNIRHQMAKSMIQQGMPTDENAQKMLLTTLRDMDQTSISRIKADIDSQAMESDRKIQEIVEKLHQTMPTGLRSAEPTDHTPQVDPEELPSFDQENGELSVGIEQETSEEFISRMEGKNE